MAVVFARLTQREVEGLACKLSESRQQEKKERKREREKERKRKKKRHGSKTPFYRLITSSNMFQVSCVQVIMISLPILH